MENKKVNLVYFCWMQSNALSGDISVGVRGLQSVDLHLPIQYVHLCLSTLILRVRFANMVQCTQFTLMTPSTHTHHHHHFYETDSQYFLRQVVDFPWDSSVNESDRHDITEIMLKVALNTPKHKLLFVIG